MMCGVCSLGYYNAIIGKLKCLYIKTKYESSSDVDLFETREHL
jgi:hypothetical protein